MAVASAAAARASGRSADASDSSVITSNERFTPSLRRTADSPTMMPPSKMGTFLEASNSLASGVEATPSTSFGCSPGRRWLCLLEMPSGLMTRRHLWSSTQSIMVMPSSLST